MSTISSLISSGGGGGSEVNDTKYINSRTALITTESGEKWLQSGTLNTDTATYSDATALVTGATYTNSNYTPPNQGSVMSGLMYDGTNFWISYRNSQMISKYSFNGSAFTHISNMTIGSGTEPVGMDYIASSVNENDNGVAVIYVADSNGGHVKRWNASTGGVMSTYITSQGGCFGVVVIDDVVYVGRQNGYVYMFSALNNAAAAPTAFAIAEVGTQGQNMTKHNGYIWVTNRSGVAYKYSTGGVYQGSTADLNPASVSSTEYGGLAFVGDKLYSNNNQDNKVYQFNPNNSVGISAKSTQGGAPLYTRIK